MPKKISKSDAVKSIQNADALEVLFQEIKRSASDASKRSDLNRFVREVQEQIKDERDIQLYSVKIK